MINKILIYSVLFSLSISAEIKEKWKIREILNKSNVVEFHRLLKLQALDKIDFSELSTNKKEQFISYATENFKIDPLNKYLIDEISNSFNDEDLKELKKIFESPFFEKMHAVLLNIYRDKTQDSEALAKYMATLKEANDNRLALSQNIITNSQLDQSENEIVQLMGKLFYVEYNEHLKLNGLSKLELSLIFRNMEKKEKIDVEDKLSKLFYYKTRKSYISELVEFNRLIKRPIYIKYMSAVVQIFSLYYDLYLEEKGTLNFDKSS